MAKCQARAGTVKIVCSNCLPPAKPKQPNGDTDHRLIGFLGASLFATLLFSNLAARVSHETIINISVVAIIATTAILGVISGRFASSATFALLLVVIIACFSLDPRNNPTAIIQTLYIFGLPVASYFSGKYLGANRSAWARPLTLSLGLFIGYGLFQALVFLTGDFETTLPWDSQSVTNAQRAGVTNLYQGQLLRFFGPMNSFFEFQLTSSVLIPFVWVLYRRDPKLLKLRHVQLLTVAHLLFLIVAIERTPIIVSAIMYLSLLRLPRQATAMIAGILLTIAITSAAWIVSASHAFGAGIWKGVHADAITRLNNVLTLNFSADSAIRTRSQVIWTNYSEMFLTHPIIGVGSGRLADASLGPTLQIQPHNGYLAYGLAFGSLALVILAGFTVSSLCEARRLRPSERRYLYALVTSYSLVAIFDVPWIGKSGVLFFLLIGVLTARNGWRRHGQLRILDCRVVVKPSAASIGNEGN